MNMKKKKLTNMANIKFLSLSKNEAFARSVVCSFISPLDPTVEEMGDLRCAVSEAVTNCIVHAYKGEASPKPIEIKMKSFDDRSVEIAVCDKGCGIENISEAITPFYTTDAKSERSGMGFSIMSSFTDKMTVRSKCGVGTRVTLKKKFGE